MFVFEISRSGFPPSSEEYKTRVSIFSKLIVPGWCETRCRVQIGRKHEPLLKGKFAYNFFLCCPYFYLNIVVGRYSFGNHWLPLISFFFRGSTGLSENFLNGILKQNRIFNSWDTQQKTRLLFTKLCRQWISRVFINYSSVVITYFESNNNSRFHVVRSSNILLIINAWYNAQGSSNIYFSY